MTAAEFLRPDMDAPWLIEWEDSARPHAGWAFLDEMPSAEVVRCRSVGWIVAETDAVLMLAPNLGDAESEAPQGCGFLRIPKRAVVRRASLSEAL